MKKNLLIICFSFLTFALFAQLSVTGKHLLLKKDSVKVIIFDSIASDYSISYTGTNVRFYKFDEVNSMNYSTALFPPDDATGYLIEEDGVTVDTIWVIDYHNYSPIFNSIKAGGEPAEQCERLDVLFDVSIPELTYKTLSGSAYQLPREYKFTYNTLEWTGSWQTVEKDSTLTTPLPSSINIAAPLCNTYFSLSGDQYAIDLNIEKVYKDQAEYNAVAVKSSLISVVTTRDQKNENERPSVASQVSGSAPLEMQFLSNANEPVAKFYNWTIYKGDNMIINRTDKDHRYTFTEAGVYNVKLTVSNDVTCSYTDSMSITVSESRIEVPNVFTPNGDGFNDEFRVAFKSIIKFDCWVYNRWERLVYHWSDPTKGWDGKIGGKDAVPGPYFYVIKAYGSDYDPKSEPNKETKRRVGEYILKGDINLLRGVK